MSFWGSGGINISILGWGNPPRCKISVYSDTYKSLSFPGYSFSLWTCLGLRIPRGMINSLVVNFTTTKILDIKIKIMNAKVKGVKKTKGKNITKIYILNKKNLFKIF